MLLLFPSLAEGLGMVVVEATGAGLRVPVGHDSRAKHRHPGDGEFLPLADPERWV